jgi:nucleotide-binding universal stress UspA family protein
MPNLNKLLNTKNSKLAWLLRLKLLGLQTELQEALKTEVSDPGSDACQELLQELNVILESQTQSNNTEEIPTWEDVLEPVSSQDTQLKLKPITQTLLSHKQLSQYIGEYQFYANDDAQLWNEMQRLLLRVPEKLADKLRSQLIKQVIRLGAGEDKFSLQQLPFPTPEHIYSGLKGNIQAHGLCLSNTINFDERLQTQRSGTELDILAAIVSICLQFIEKDPHLHHALRSVDRFGIRSLNSVDKPKYIAALIERYYRVKVTFNTDLIVSLRARLDLDEAIHSLTYLPCVDRFSWWGKLQQEARRTLETVAQQARQAGISVQIRPLWGTYADVYPFSKDDLQVDAGGIPGEVSACLRVYAKINDEILPGRVLFRSS